MGSMILCRNLYIAVWPGIIQGMIFWPIGSKPIILTRCSNWATGFNIFFLFAVLLPLLPCEYFSIIFVPFPVVPSVQSRPVWISHKARCEPHIATNLYQRLTDLVWTCVASLPIRIHTKLGGVFSRGLNCYKVLLNHLWLYSRRYTSSQSELIIYGVTFSLARRSTPPPHIYRHYTTNYYTFNFRFPFKGIKYWKCSNRRQSKCANTTYGIQQVTILIKLPLGGRCKMISRSPTFFRERILRANWIFFLVIKFLDRVQTDCSGS